MQDKYIFFVGKPYPFADAHKLIRDMGFKVGVLLDKAIRLNNLERYDLIIPLDFTSPEAALNGLEGHDIQAAGLVCTYENYIRTKAYIGTKLGLPTISPISADLCTDKLLMRQAFMQHNPNITPRFGLVDNKGDLMELASTLQFPLIIKPTNLVKSLLIMRCDTQEELLNNFSYARKNIAKLYEKYKIYDRKPQLIVEEYITGAMCTIAAFVDADGEPHLCEGITALITAQNIGKSDNYLYARQLPANLKPELVNQLKEAARQGIAALNMTSTPAHVEVIYNDTGVKIVEIGARIGGYRPRMYQLSYGLDLIRAEIMLALGQKPELDSEFRAYSAVYELFPDKEGDFKELADQPTDNQFATLRINAKPGERIGPAKNGYKAAAVITLKSTDQTTFSSLCESVGSLKVVTT